MPLDLFLLQAREIGLCIVELDEIAFLTRVAPLLDRVIRRLSSEAAAALDDLSLAQLPLGGPALKILYRDPAALQELRDASLLAAYRKRVQLLPMVAAVVRQRLTPTSRRTAEGRLIEALRHWLERGIADAREKGLVLTELACLLLLHHRLLATAELVLYHGWLSFHAGQILRLARRVQQAIAERPWASPETGIEAESGALLLHYYLAPYLGEVIAAEQRREDYERMYAWVTAGQLRVEPLMEVHLVDHLMLSRMNEDRYEEALRLLEDCSTRLGPLLSGDPELHAALLSKRASLYGEWSEYAESHGQPEQVKRKRSQSIAAYEESFALLQRAWQEEGLSPLRRDTVRKKQATVLNNLAYQLNSAGRLTEALQSIDQCIALKEQGYADLDSLAASYGEKSQILAALGEFEEALRFDELARAEIGRSADAGDTRSQADRWIYQVNQARLYLLLGRAEEAERLLRETLAIKTQRRRAYKVLAEKALQEIERAKASSPDGRFQLDWRWVSRYRGLSAYDAYWWWAPAGPFSDEERRQWDLLFTPRVEEATKDQLREILVRSRDRELGEARSSHREPQLSYPAIDIAEVRRRIADFLQLDTEIAESEPNVVVRRLYHGAVEDEVYFLRLIEATYECDGERFWELMQQLYPPPTAAEMHYALEQVRQVLLQGLRLPEEESISEMEQERRNARADFYEQKAAALHSDPVDDSGTWLGTLAVGLACGIAGPPQTFSTLLAFFEPFLLLYRLLWRDDEDRETAERRARRNASTRCLRTFRGVPDLEQAGICNTKDVVYLRGRLLIDQMIAQDETVLDRLAVGKVACELLPELEKLGITSSAHTFRTLALDPDLDVYILSFEIEGDGQ